MQKGLKNIPKVNKWQILKWMPAFYRNTLPTVVKFTATYGDFLNLQFTKKSKMILVNHPTYVQHILKTYQDNYSRKKILGNLEGLLGDGIFASEGELWEQQHQLIKPALHEKLVKDYFQIIHRETLVLVDKWKVKAYKQQEVDVEYDINILMLKILIQTQLCASFNRDFDVIIDCLRVFLSENNPKNFYVHKLKNQFRAALKLKPLQNQKVKVALQNLDVIIQNIRATAQQNPTDKGLVLEILENACAEGKISDKQVMDEIKNFIFAGFDTTASALTWSLYCVTQNSTQTAKLRQEILEVLGGNLPQMEHLAHMPFTKMFLQESMRLYPPVYALLRVSLEEDEVNGYFVPRKSWVAINIYSLHRHPDFWENPEVFDPLRFNSENFKGKAFAYIPFGQGKRACIGKPLAMAELQIILPILLQNFNFKLLGNQQPIIRPDIIIKAKNPLLMQLEVYKNE
jgi:cytochrome P450